MTGWILALAAYVVTLNGLTLAAFGYDKCAARRGLRRVPEMRLLGLSCIGGSPGAFLGSHLFRHKTHKQPFRRRLWQIVAGQIILGGALLIAIGFV